MGHGRAHPGRGPGWWTGSPARWPIDLGLPYVDGLDRALDGGEPQTAMQNSAQQLGNAHAKLAIDGAAVRAGPVLLVDDIVDSGWTLTVAGWLLRTHGSGAVHPFALAVASARDD